MEQSVLDRNLGDELSDSLEALDVQLAQPASSNALPSYRPTPWALVNQALDVVDRVSGGRAAWVQRLFSFTFIGGCAAIVNMTVYNIVMYGIKMPVNPIIHNAIAFILASEISILANFIANDYLTFRHLSGHGRSWSARCMRFHVTAAGGTILTYLIQFALLFGLHAPAFMAQATALILVLFYNFSFHHLFTYRQVKTAH